jgi:intracellular septation protein A
MQPQYYYNLLDAIVYFIAATVPVYFILKSNNKHLRNITIALVSFILLQGVYHIAGTIGFKLLAKGFLEPSSIIVLLLFGVIYLLSVLREKRSYELKA